jgi:hypothetical protein
LLQDVNISRLAGRHLSVDRLAQPYLDNRHQANGGGESGLRASEQNEEGEFFHAILLTDVAFFGKFVGPTVYCAEWEWNGFCLRY